MKYNKIFEGISRLAGICQSYSILHYKVSIITYYTDLILGLLSGCITTSTGILLAQEKEECKERVLQENNIKIPLLFTSATINFCQQFLGLAKSSALHMESYKKYQKIYNDIICYRSNLGEEDKKNKEKNKNFLISINQEINNLILKSPPIDPLIAFFSHDKFKKHKIKIPELQEIESNSHTPQNNNSEVNSNDNISIDINHHDLM